MSKVTTYLAAVSPEGNVWVARAEHAINVSATLEERALAWNRNAQIVTGAMARALWIAAGKEV